MTQTLIKEDKYEGKYVALVSFDDHRVIGVGAFPNEAYNNAKEKGFKDPVIVYVPHKDAVLIY